MSAPIRLSNPSEIVSSIPHLLGFTPSESVVVLWMRDRQVLVTQRFDLPGPLSDSDLEDFQQQAFGHQAARMSDDAFIIVITDNMSDQGTRAIPRLLTGRFTERQIDRVLVTDMARVRVLGGGDVRDVQPARDVFGDRYPAADRSMLEQEYAESDVLDKALFAQVVTEIRAVPDEALGDWMREVVDTVGADVLDGGEISDSQAVRLLIAWSHPHGRDRFVVALANHDRSAAAPLASLTRRTPQEFKAPCATLAAIAAYLAGDGARANVALDIATAADPDYGLADSISAAVSSGIPPQEVRAVLQRDLTDAA